MPGMALVCQRCIQAPPYLSGANERCHSTPRPPTATLELSLTLQARGSLGIVLRFSVSQDPGHHAPACLAYQRVELPLKHRHRPGRQRIVEQLIQQAHTWGAWAGEVPNPGPQGSCHQDLCRCRMHPRGAPDERHDGCWALPPCHHWWPLASHRIHSGALSSSMGIARSHPRDLNRLFMLRNIGDYGETRHVSPDEAAQAIVTATAFLRTMNIAPCGRTKALARRTPSCSHYSLDIPLWA